MDQLHLVLHRWPHTVMRNVIMLSVAFLLFSFLGKLFRLNRARKPWRATLLDLQYAVLGMFYPPFLYFIISAVFGLMALEIKSASHDPHVSAWSFGGQFLAVLVIRDCLIYIRHRIFHLPRIWAFHSIHHSSEEVDWISAVRFHPAENMIEMGAEMALFLSCGMAGFDAEVLSLSALSIGFYNFFIHSNLPWTFGPLRYVLVSPVQHRWHHSDRPEAQDKNFAAMFSLLDVALGTFYMPKGVRPETTGLSGQERAVHPKTMAGQLLYPFRKSQS